MSYSLVMVTGRWAQIPGGVLPVLWQSHHPIASWDCSHQPGENIVPSPNAFSMAAVYESSDVQAVEDNEDFVVLWERKYDTYEEAFIAGMTEERTYAEAG